MHSSSRSVFFAWRRTQKACSCYGSGGEQSPSENELDDRTIHVAFEVWSPLSNPEKIKVFHIPIKQIMMEDWTKLA